MLKTYKYQIYPSNNQLRVLEQTLDKCRFLYNCALEQRIRAFSKGVSLSNYTQQKELAQLKQELPEFSCVYSHVLQDVLTRLDKAYKAFFSRLKRGDKAGFPRFQGKHRFDSFHFKEYKQTPTEKSVYLPKIGNVRINLHRPIGGKIKTCTVKRDSCGDWFVTFACEVIAKPLAKTGLNVGIDRGITAVIATSDGHLETNPRHYTKAEKALAKAQRRLARKVKGSNQREQTRLIVAKIHRKVQRQRLDFLHKLSTNLIKNYDAIVLEDLNVKGMSRSNLAKHILDAGWSTFLQQLLYKAECADRVIKLVNPAYTSQTCAICNHIAKENRKTQALFNCVSCGHQNNADVNAAQVILGRGLLPTGANVEVFNSCVA